ncbi:nitroreductase family protein [Colwellia sp. MB02u-18]|uniref:nitroreductase family protein n=1 Tax=unclassified Colwellia TaxID=196834 RepID=UPI0015F6EE40|nr:MULTISPECIES: nitroreductase family protein [unclassified Colwellia]MBA6223980.1 nitroreductase family protein [Colwellia sp. MB3u-45]MBA6266113.1 nitroreductase family protein [Colwellia sp. MB3u-43]MBA6320161.1 nitroreductase family protein [Colwellia sp. MB02u-19]MBA6325972.1 nitroreductase family protein [Colwellia sp. MB02u-18]MBA6332615.1 nitroreductase family protein [Colwellia sp. MB02u-12]
MKAHNSSPLSDYIEYPPEEMLQRSAEFYENIKRRHSVRSFSDRLVEKQIIENCIKAAGTAPSGANHQPWHFVAINNIDVKKQIRQQAEIHESNFYQGRASEEWLDALKPLGTDAKKPYLEHAPWLIAVFSEKTGGVATADKNTNYYVHESVGIATGFLINALHSSGLVTLTHTPKPMSFLSKICGRDDNSRPYMLLIVGYPSEDATIPDHATTKKALADIATFL